MLRSVAEPKLFVSAPTFKKFLLQLQLKLFGYLFSKLLNEKVDFSWLFAKNIDLINFFDPIQYLSLTWSRSRNFSILAPAPAPAKSFGSLRLQPRLQNTGIYFIDTVLTCTVNSHCERDSSVRFFGLSFFQGSTLYGLQISRLKGFSFLLRFSEVIQIFW